MFREVLRALYPRRCPGCAGVIAPDMLVCDECRSRFRIVEQPCCYKCGRHVPGDSDEVCSECGSRSRSFGYGVAVFEYNACMKRAMSDFKFNGHKENCDYFVHETVLHRAGEIAGFAPDALIPVPVHVAKLKSRGFNQAELLAEGVGEALNIPVISDFLVRTRKTDAQKNLDGAERAANLASAFACNTEKYKPEDIKTKLDRVMLVDDIFTTGATMEGCTRVLLNAGVGTVGILSISIGGGY